MRELSNDMDFGDLVKEKESLKQNRKKEARAHGRVG